MLLKWTVEVWPLSMVTDVYQRQQLSYVTHRGPGEGLLFFGNVIIPFVDHFPKDTSLYQIMTTRPEEVAEAGT